MKKCPYCAEQIQDEAIVCRYCGRDLPGTAEISGKKDLPTSTSKKSSSIWKVGAIWSTVITLLAAIGVILRFFGSSYSSEAEFHSNYQNLILTLTVGIVANFIGWLLVFSFLTWVWRKASHSGAKGVLLAVIGILLTVGGIVLFSQNKKPFAFLLPTPSVTKKPTQTSMQISPTSTLVPSRTISPTPITLPFFDDFSNPYSGWNVENSNGVAVEYSDGRYKLYTDGFYFAVGSPPLGILGDVRIEVDAEKLQGTDYNFFGVICRASESGFYVLGVSSIGIAQIYKYDATNNYMHLNVIGGSNITQPYKSIVHLRGDCIGNQLSLYVNDSLIGTVTDYSYSSGYVGLTAFIRNIEGLSFQDYGVYETGVIFDNFSVNRP